MNAAATLLLLLGLYGFAASALPLAANQQQVRQQSVQTPQQPQMPSDFDYSRFYFGNNNFPQYKKSDPQVPFVPSSQWSLPRQLAPKFKREFPGSYSAHDKRLDEQLFDDFYMNAKPNGFEWNFNRL